MSPQVVSPLLPHLHGYVAGRWLDSAGSSSIAVHNPATGELLATVPATSADSVEAAIAAGKALLAEPPTLAQRSAWLTKIASLLQEHADELGRIITLEHGKPWREGKAEASYAAGFFRFCADNIEALAPRSVEGVARGGSWTVHHRPAGVVGLITPWNFPLGMIAKKLSAAIAAGCPSVIKPASKTPLTMIALFTLLDRELALPAGFVNLVLGSPSVIGKVLCEHPDVPVLSFTGSTDVGKQLIEATKPRVKRLSLELGGNAPFVVFADADLEAAADQLIANKFRGGGQTCVCTNRVLADQAIAEPFAELVRLRVQKLKLGNGMDADTDIGPLIDRAGWTKVHEHVTDALQRGARLVHGEKAKAPQGNLEAYYPPTVLSKVTADMACWREETFGPLVPIAEFSSEEQAIEQANDTEYGLAAYVFTRDGERAARVIARLQFGHVGWNTGNGPTPEAPFGGMKESGYGREGGLEGMHEFTEVQVVTHP